VRGGDGRHGTTIDALDADGVFRGGLILPGLSLMRGTRGNTAICRMPPALPAQPTTRRRHRHGAIHATLGAIERDAGRAERRTPSCFPAARRELAEHISPRATDREPGAGGLARLAADCHQPGLHEPPLNRLNSIAAAPAACTGADDENGAFRAGVAPCRQLLQMLPTSWPISALPPRCCHVLLIY